SSVTCTARRSSLAFPSASLSDSSDISTVVSSLVAMREALSSAVPCDALQLRMSRCRIALANLPFPLTPDVSVALAERAIADASGGGADLIALPECFVPGSRAVGKNVAPPDAAFLERAWSRVAEAAARGRIAVVLGTERVTEHGLMISALVIDRDG